MASGLVRGIGIAVAWVVGASLPPIASARAAADDPPQFEKLISLGRYLSGYSPSGPMVADAEGRLFGVTAGGGNHAGGTLFRVRPDGTRYTDLFHFDKSTSGTGPSGFLTIGRDGRLYGTTTFGGAGGAGAVYSVATDGSGFLVLAEFDGKRDGGTPRTGVIEGLDGALYGTTSSGGKLGVGTLFRLQRDGSSLEVLLHFDWRVTGYYPTALLQTADGTLFGATSLGGPSASSGGTLFSIRPDGSSYTPLVHFDDSSVAWAPAGPPLLAQDGYLYGAAGGGAFGDGVVYRVAVDGSNFSVIVNTEESDTGAQLRPALAQAADGTFFATAVSGGRHYAGTVLRFQPDGTGLTKLLDFDPAVHGKNPSGGVRLREDGALTGLTVFGGPGSKAAGTLYELATDGSHVAALHTFSEGTHGDYSSSALIEHEDGRLYGLTSQGGAHGDGTLFRLYGDGSGFEVLHDFKEATSGRNPPGPLAVGAEGVLFGVTAAGGAGVWGTAFRFDPYGRGFETIVEFSSATRATRGVLPSGGLLLAEDGLLYGTCLSGGAYEGGTLFRVERDGSHFELLHAFDRWLEGDRPNGALIEGSDGVLYGTTDGLFSSGDDGTVFRVERDGSDFATLFVFDFFANAAWPGGGLIELADGSLAGTTAGTRYGQGSVFKLQRDGSSFEILRDFSYSEGQYPRSSLIELPDGRLCGTAQLGGKYGDGTLFAIAPDGSEFTVLHDFEEAAEGGDLLHSPLLASDGNLYGATRVGGEHGRGTVYRVLMEYAAFRSNYGTGFPGALGVPTLTAQAPPRLGTTLHVDVGNSAGTPTLAALVVGSLPASVPLAKGGDLLVDVQLVTVFALPAEGVTLATDLDDDPDLVGLELHAQLLMVDAGAAGGQSASAGLKLHLGY